MAWTILTAILLVIAIRQFIYNYFIGLIKLIYPIIRIIAYVIYYMAKGFDGVVQRYHYEK